MIWRSKQSAPSNYAAPWKRCVIKGRNATHMGMVIQLHWYSTIETCAGRGNQFASAVIMPNSEDRHHVFLGRPYAQHIHGLSDEKCPNEALGIRMHISALKKLRHPSCYHDHDRPNYGDSSNMPACAITRTPTAWCWCGYSSSVETLMFFLLFYRCKP